MTSKFFTPAGKRKRAVSTPMVRRFRKKRRITDSDTRFRSSIPLIRRPDFGFPDKLVTRLRYCDVFALTGAVGVVGDNIFRMNSLFDPDFSGVGHQPMWYDQLCGTTGPYNRYRVLGSKITVKFSVTNAPSLVATNVAPVLVGCFPEANNTLLATTASQLMENSNSNWKILGDKSGGNNVITCTATYSPNRDLGLDTGDDTISAAYNANPSQQFYCHVFKVDDVGTSTIAAYVEIEYYAEFFDRNEIAQS